MKRKWLAVGISTVSVVLLILTSLSNVVGYQTVQTSQQNRINERINQRELLFQTICDIVNNKEIQRIILKSQVNRGIIPTLDIPVVTKQQLRQMYFIGLILSKVISKSRMQSMVQQYQLINPYLQKEISAFIKKDAKLREEISHLSKLNTLLNTSIFEILMFIILFIPLFIVFLVSGFLTFVSFSIALVALIIEKYTGVWILGNIITLIVGFSMLILLNVFLISFYLLYRLFGGEIPPFIFSY